LDLVLDWVTIGITSRPTGSACLIPAISWRASLVDVGLLGHVDNLAIVFDDRPVIATIDTSGRVWAILSVL
jgi:hypothetical protein